MNLTIKKKCKFVVEVLDVPDQGDSRSENPIYVYILIRPQNAKYFPTANDEKFNITQIGNVTYQMDRNFEENPDLEPVSAQMLYSICYS